MARTISTELSGQLLLASDGMSAGSDAAWRILNDGPDSETASSAAEFYFAGSGWILQNSSGIQAGAAGANAFDSGPSRLGVAPGAWAARAVSGQSQRSGAASHKPITLALVSDTGSSSTDGVTSDAALTGKAAKNATVTLSEGGTTLGVTTANASGVWNFTPSALSQGAHTIVASTANASASLTFTYDTVAPVVTEDFINGELTGTGDPNATVTLSENGVAIGAATADASGAWTYAPTSLTAGSHTVVASETDSAGNSGSVSLAFTYSPTPPPTPVTLALVSDTGSSSTDGVTNNAALTGTAAANATVTLSEGATTMGVTTTDTSGVWNFTPTPLSQGAHTIVASAAGASASLTFTYDTVAPAVTEAFVNGALTGTGDPNATVTLSENNVAIGAAKADASGAWTYAPTSLTAGSHTVVASETDSAGNSGSATLTFDIATPAVPRYSHIVVVVEENKDYNQIIGNLSQAPYINSLASNGALLTNFAATTHPSQPNYFDLYAGSTFGVTDDGSYSEPGPTLYNTLKAAGLSFQGYVDEPGGSDFNHDPWVSFPEGYSVQTDFSSFPALFPGGDYSSLPTVSFVIPGVEDDMHNGTIQQGDSWLQTNLSSYAQWAQANNSLLAVVWDESDSATTDPNNIVPAILYGANIVSGQYNTAYGFENLLSTITHSYGLTAPNNAAFAAPITGMFTNT